MSYITINPATISGGYRMRTDLIGLENIGGSKIVLGAALADDGYVSASNPMPVVFPGGATAAQQDTIIANLQALNSLIPSTFDYFALGYTGDDLTTAVFKTGGSSGATVATITLAYTGGKLISGTRT